MSTEGIEMLAMKCDYIHALFQEMEDLKYEIPMADYMTIYGYLEDIREFIMNG